MSRIGRKPIPLPNGVEISIENSHIAVKGPKGQLERTFSPSIQVSIEGDQVLVQRESDVASIRALHGTTRAVLNNMITGVSSGFERILEIDGVGYRAEMNGTNLMLYVGYSKPVEIPPPDGISFDVDPKVRQVKIYGFNIEQVGQMAADIRKVRPPEPYKGKGIHYLGEKIRRKVGKTGKGKGK